MLGVSADEIQLNREDNAIDIAKKYNASAVVLKGHNTLVYIKSEDKTFICENGGPELATGGTGDILAGIISALLAQNLPLKESFPSLFVASSFCKINSFIYSIFF